MPHKVSAEVSKKGTLEGWPVKKQAFKEEEVEILKREENASSTPVGDVQYEVNLSKDTVEHQTQRGDIKNGTLACNEQVENRTHKRDTKTPKTLTGDVLILRKTRKEINGHHTVIKDFMALKRDHNRHVTPCEGSLKTPRRDSGTRTTP